MLADPKLKRENIFGDEGVQILLDTFDDDQRAFVFAANPYGVQLDSKLTEGQGYDYTELMVVNLEGTGLETIIPPKPGVIAANAMVVLLGERAPAVIPMKPLRIGIAALFLLSGFIVAISASEVASAFEPGRWKMPMATAFLLSR